MTRYRDPDFRTTLQKVSTRVKSKRNTRDRIATITRLKNLMLQEAEKGETYIVLSYWVEDTAMEFFENSGFTCERSDYPRVLKYCPCSSQLRDDHECMCTSEDIKVWIQQRETHRRTTIRW